MCKGKTHSRCTLLTPPPTLAEILEFGGADQQPFGDRLEPIVKALPANMAPMATPPAPTSPMAVDTPPTSHETRNNEILDQYLVAYKVQETIPWGKKQAIKLPHLHVLLQYLPDSSPSVLWFRVWP